MGPTECAPPHPPGPFPRALPQPPPARTLVTVDLSGTDMSGHPVQLLVPHSAPGIPRLGGVGLCRLRQIGEWRAGRRLQSSAQGYLFSRDQLQ